MSDGTDLRSLLRAADQGLGRQEYARVDRGDRTLAELASLIGAIEDDRPERPERAERPERLQSFTRSVPDDMADTSDSEDHEPAPKPVIHEILDHTVIRYGSAYALRGNGHYLTAVHDESYLLGVEGQGVGEAADALAFVPIGEPSTSLGVKYGQMLAIKSSFAKERLLGLRDGVKLGFWRHLIGAGEKWVILPNTTQGPSNAINGSMLGGYVRIGDSILLQAKDHLLGADGSARLLPRSTTNTPSCTTAWQIELFGTVPLPQWCSRPYLSGRHLQCPVTIPWEAELRAFPRNGTSTSAWETKTLDSLKVPEQGAVLVREMLHVLGGVEGVYIRTAAKGRESYEGVRYAIDMDSVDRATASKVSQLFPIAEALSRIRSFLQTHGRYEYGLVSHALCAAIKHILRDMDVLITQLEHLLNTSRLTIQRLSFLLHPSAALLHTLDSLCAATRGSIGGDMLNRLHAVYEVAGDAKTKEMLGQLLEKAAGPFCNMLAVWIFRGELQDTYNEFMVSCDPTIAKEALVEDFNASYWDAKYSLRLQHTPCWLAAHAERILVVGKYLNVVRDCMGDQAMKSKPETALIEAGKDAPQLSEDALALSLAPHGMASTLRAIDSSYSTSSAALLHILLSKYALLSHMDCLHNYFLLKHGDFFNQFMDAAEAELKKDVREINVRKLNYHLAVCIGDKAIAAAAATGGGGGATGSTGGAGAGAGGLACTLAGHTLIQHLHLIQTAGAAAGSPYDLQQGLKGIEAFTLDYTCSFPLSIVLSRRVVTKYQLLSRLLYFSKHVERRVLALWMAQQGTRDLSTRQALGDAHALRHRMLHFIQNFVYYITFEVIHPLEHTLRGELTAAKDMDQVLSAHERFLDAALKECLLASQELLGVLTKIMTTCLLYADHMITKMNEATADPTYAPQTALTVAKRPLSPNTRPASFKKASSMSQEEESLAKVTAKMAAILDKRRARVERNSAYIQQEAKQEAYARILKKFQDTFDKQLKDFLDNLWNNSYRHHAQLANLCVRLDYNGYYTSQFAPAF